jgi:lipoprotein-releasing system permease protein
VSYENFIAFRYLRAKRKQGFISLITFLSIAGVAVGVMALVVVIAVMAGAESDFRSRILGVESHIILMRYGAPVKDYQQIAVSVAEVEGVQTVAPFVYSQVMLRSAAGAVGAMLRGIDPVLSGRMIKGFRQDDLIDRLSASPDIHPPPEEVPDAEDGLVRPGIVLGHELARSLGVREGDLLYMLSPRGMLSPVGHIPSMKRFQVTGIFESGMYEYDSSLAYVHLKVAQNMLRMKDAVTGLGIWIDDIYQAAQVREQIVARVGTHYWTRDWMQINQSLFSALKLEKTAMFVILTLIIFVAAFNIASSLIMMVMEKARDIAILKAMGATHRSIRKIFVFNGLIIGLIGTSLGVGLGLLICFLLKRYHFIELPAAYPFSTLPVQLEWLDVAVIAASAMLICFLATLYPAIQASRLNPVDAVRYE